jgi:hypothetical protein
MACSEKVLENRLRRMAQRQGLAVHKTRRRDPRAIDYRAYWIIDPDSGAVVAGDVRYGMTIEQVEAYLLGDSQVVRFEEKGPAM